MMRIVLALAVSAFSLTAFAQSYQVFKREPGIGLLKEGEAVLVDDGTCPKGQIKKVVGGNNQRETRTPRRRSCVPR